MIAFNNPAADYLELRDQIDAALARVSASGWYIGGAEVAAFEDQYAAWCEARYCVGVGNGLDALHLALVAMDVGAGDEVIVSSNGYIATWLAVSMAGATPVPVEPDPTTHNLDPGLIEAAITSRTRVVLPTHLYGQSADLGPILAVARRHELRVLEDAAQAHGARYDGKRIGGHGDAVAWSFYPTKNLGAMGDGGAVTTNDAALADRVRALGNYGSRQRYVNDERGFNSRLDPLQAAILAAKLPRLDDWNARRRAIADCYNRGLADLGMRCPRTIDGAESVWHLYVIATPRRASLIEALEAADIQTLIHYPIPPHRQRAYADLGLGEGAYPLAESMAEQVLSLPIGPHMTLDEAKRVVEVIREWSISMPGPPID